MIGQNLIEDIMRNPLLNSLLGYSVALQPHFSVKQNDGTRGTSILDDDGSFCS